jgi:hypothetical protein
MVVVTLFSFDLSSTMGSSCTETPHRSCRSTYTIYTGAAMLEQELLCKTLANMWQGGWVLTGSTYTKNSTVRQLIWSTGVVHKDVHHCHRR